MEDNFPEQAIEPKELTVEGDKPGPPAGTFSILYLHLSLTGSANIELLAEKGLPQEKRLVVRTPLWLC